MPGSEDDGEVNAVIGIFVQPRVQIVGAVCLCDVATGTNLRNGVRRLE